MKNLDKNCFEIAEEELKIISGGKGGSTSVSGDAGTDRSSNLTEEARVSGLGTLIEQIIHLFDINTPKE